MTKSPHDPTQEPADESSTVESNSVETVSLTTPQDLLSAVPYLLGFQPDDGLVVLGIDQQGQLVITISADVPPMWETADAADAIAACLGRVATAMVMVVGYCPQHRATTLTRFADMLPWPVQELLMVSDQRWWSLACSEVDCCPPEGEPVVQQDRIAAPLLVTTGAPAPSRQALAASLSPGPGDFLDRVRTHLDAAPTSGRTPSARSGYVALTQARADRVAGSTDLPPERAAVLLAALRNLTVRDACVLWEDDAALALWQDLLRAAPPGWGAPAAALLAMAAYLRGDGVLARLAAERALDDDPGYNLARLVRMALRQGLPPHGLGDAFADALRDNPLVADPPAIP